MTKNNSALLSLMKESYIKSFNSVQYCPVTRYDLFDVQPANRQLGVFATRNLSSDTVIDGVIRFLTKINTQVITREMEFSIFHSTARCSQIMLMLGPLSFINHACVPNVRWEATSRGRRDTKCLQARTFAADEELFVSYGNDYFGEGNEGCLCLFCEGKKSSAEKED